MGFCMGVRRAVQIMEEEASPDVPVYSIGEIVHNPHVVAHLREAGVVQLPGPDDIDGDVGAATAATVKNGRVAITAHGVGEKVVQELTAAELDLVDTTCPIVTRAQRYAQKFVRDGCHVLILGDPGHKEVRGIMGWTTDASGESRGTVIESAELDDLAALISDFPRGFPNKVGLMAQTTNKVEDFAKFVSNLMLLQRNENFDLHAVNTLCHATTGQQNAAATLARESDLMIVVGGKNSANTRHLREVCEAEGTRAFHVEGPTELQSDWFYGINVVGLAAGASTPDSSVDDVEARIRSLTGS